MSDAADPLADLMFTLSAALLMAIALQLASAGESVQPDAEAIRATAAGLRWGPHGERQTPLDRIASDAALAAYLRARAQGGAAVALIVADAGREAAFALEPVLAKAGVTRLAQTRLAPECAGGCASPP